ncbi:hypothetical protein [Parasitella parasitica]|uniref:HTH psq-type domain-containing protein n=1 Tax=Parasitella parasitica TaxID=35722 RepID=A0A0B7MR38_9FUNG|nr:hypothetical protein [Parasitella parasitica]
MTRTLSSQTHKTTKKEIPSNIRELIIEQVVMEGKISQAEAARRYNIPRTSIRNILDAWYNEGRIYAKPRGEELQAKLLELADKGISASGLWRFLAERIGFTTLKRTKAVEERQNSPETIEQRYDYIISLRHHEDFYALLRAKSGKLERIVTYDIRNEKGDNTINLEKPYHCSMDYWFLTPECAQLAAYTFNRHVSVYRTRCNNLFASFSTREDEGVCGSIDVAHCHLSWRWQAQSLAYNEVENGDIKFLDYNS